MKYIRINFGSAVPMTIQEAEENGYNLNGYTHGDGYGVSYEDNAKYWYPKEGDRNILTVSLIVTRMKDNKINNNNHDYVDLNLPSGTLWATMNVGASKPSDYGLYFQWGDTQGYTADQVGKDKQFNWADYKFSIDGSSLNFSKYTKTRAKLDLVDDAAHVNMGGEWHMPTSVQIQELIDNTTSTWTTQDGVNGRLFTSKKNPSKSIFFPSAGNAWGGSVLGSGDYGDVWSSMLGTDNVSYGQDLSFSSDGVHLGDDLRCYGLFVRGVIG